MQRWEFIFYQTNRQKDHSHHFFSFFLSFFYECFYFQWESLLTAQCIELSYLYKVRTVLSSFKFILALKAFCEDTYIELKLSLFQSCWPNRTTKQGWLQLFKTWRKLSAKLNLVRILSFHLVFAKKLLVFPPLFQVMIMSIMQKEKTNRYVWWLLVSRFIIINIENKFRHINKLIKL